MALVTKLYTFSAGATILAAEHNSNFDVIYNDYNGNITNANCAAGMGLVDTKLAQITSNDKVHASALVATDEASGDMFYLNSAGSWVRSPSAVSGTINYIFDGAGAAVATGIGAGFIVVDFPCTLVRAVLLTDRLSVVNVDVRKDTYGNFPVRSSDTICGGANKPRLRPIGATYPTSFVSSYMDETLTGWTTALAAGDIIRFCLNSCNSAQAVSVALKFRRP